MATKKNIERDAAIARLREWIKPGDTIYCILRHRSSTGMSRTISLKGIRCENGKARMSEYSYNVALATESRYNRNHEGVTIGGCGMDMGFALVSHLSCVLFPDGAEIDGKHVGRDYVLQHQWI